MKRSLLILSAVVALASVSVSGTFAGYSDSTTNSTSVSSSSTFAPIKDTVDVPSISGTLQVGHLLTADPGTWRSHLAVSFTYKWTVCVVAVCTTPLTFTTLDTITPTLGATGIQLTVRADNSLGHTDVSTVQQVIAP